MNKLKWSALILMLLAFPVISKADNGQLNINNEVIYNDEKKAQQKNVSGFTIDNRLFLDEMNQNEQQKQRAEQGQIQHASHINFVTPVRPHQSVTEEAKRRLFQPQYSMKESITSGTRETKQTPWLKYIGYFSLGLGGVGITVLGVVIGKQYTLRKRSKKEENNGKETNKY